MKIVAANKKAYHDYHIEESHEAGMMLKGTEVKSLRGGRANLKDSFARVENEEIFLYNCHISPYSHGNIANHDPLRTRKLLMHKGEIQRLMGKMMQKGYTLLPLKIYFKDGKAKIELALAKGKKQYDKREDIKKRDAAREMEKAFKEEKR